MSDATHEYDVVIVGGGPSGASCAYWLASAGWSVALIEKKTYPRAKTCGDGLTPRAVRQLADMGLESEVAAHGHKYQGLRAFGFGGSVEMQWPRTTNFPDYGYTITRFSLDGLVADAAQAAGATVLTGTEALSALDVRPAEWSLAGAAGVRARAEGREFDVRGTYVVVADGQISRIGRELGTERNRSWPMGMALRGYYRSDRHDEPWIDSHLDIKDPTGAVVPGYGWIFPLGDGRVNVGVGLLSTGGAWKGVNTTKLQDYFVDQVGREWGLSEATSCGPPTGGKLPMGLSVGPRVGVNTLAIGDAAGSINPFNGEGIAYGYETGRLAATVLADALVSHDPARLSRYEAELERTYGDYFTVARAFVRLISHPDILAGCVGLGMKVKPIMRALLPIMSNLMRTDATGPSEAGYRALVRLASLVPDDVFQRLSDEVAA